jgi:hypothetical protein
MTSRTKAIASLSGVFLLGAFIGALVVGIIARNRAYEAERFRQREGFEMMIVDRLRLTEAQRDSLKDELEQTFAELDELRLSTANEYSALLDTLKQRISPQLTAEQRTLLADMDLNFRRGFPGGKHRPPHPPPGMGPLPEDRPVLTPEPPSSVPGDSVKHSAVPNATKKNETKANGEASITKGSADSSAGNGSGGTVPATPPLEARFAEQLRDELGLNDSQFQHVVSIVRDTRVRNARAWTELSADPLLRRKTMRGNLLEMHRSIKSELTADQWEKYKELPIVRRQR